MKSISKERIAECHMKICGLMGEDFVTEMAALLAMLQDTKKLDMTIDAAYVIIEDIVKDKKNFDDDLRVATFALFVALCSSKEQMMGTHGKRTDREKSSTGTTIH